MVKYPIGIQPFEKIRQGGYLYIDKTQYVYDLANSFGYVFLSRPRRFGKSLLTSTFNAYFSGRKDLFEGLAMYDLEKEWPEHPVMQFSLSTAKLGTIEDLFTHLNLQLTKIEEKYDLENSIGLENPGARFQDDVIKLYKKTQKKVVILIDEYDAPMLSVLGDDTKLEAMRTALQSFYAPLKDLDPYLRFAFLTGITKFSQLSIFSQLNNLENISMQDKFAGICGITQAELEANFTEGIKNLSSNNEWTHEETLANLKRMYDGYHFSKTSKGTYNPFSLLRCMKDCELEQYWFATGTPTFLVKQLQYFKTDITRIDGSECEMEEFDAPTENMHSIIPLFYQSGYLTIKHYDKQFNVYTLGFPNEEGRIGITRMLIPYYVDRNTLDTGNACLRMCKALIKDDIDEALSIASKYIKSIPYQEGTLQNAPTTEGHFTAMLYVILSFLTRHVYSKIRMATSRMDILIQPATTTFVMELKLDGSAEEALQQINNKGYAIPYETDNRKVVKVGINFSTTERTISEWKVEK